MRKFFIFLLSSLAAISLYSHDFTRKDSLRGTLSQFRTCYDVNYYNLFVIVDEKEQSLERSFNEIYFTAVSDFEMFQIDLASNMEILLIEFEDNNLNYSREFDAVFVRFPRVIKAGEQLKIKVWYTGYPRRAINPPWDGGFSWKTDKNKNPWVGVSCQGLGASVWWPNKDHQSDEPDSMCITVSARYPSKIVCNGNLRNDTTIWIDHFQDYFNQSEWFVSYPINNYNVTLNIGDFVHFQENYITHNDTLDLSYYVLSYNEDKARSHFKQVVPTLSCFENVFGRYPYWNDGFALVETPYLGMEHQSAIVYGNNYLPGYRGNLSYTAGLEFDYIIVHETGHEWWGNSVTTNDIADMWIHEAFCTYSEALYVECMYGYNEMIKYVSNQKRFIKNKSPIVGCYHVNNKGSNDMYHKGSLMLHTFRTIVDNDKLWFSVLRGILDTFNNKTIDASEIIAFINEKCENDYSIFFSQYLEHTKLPEFQYKLIREGRNITMQYRWESIENFNMTLLVNSGSDDFWIYPTSDWKEISLGKMDPRIFRVVEEMFLIDVKKVK